MERGDARQRRGHGADPVDLDALRTLAAVATAGSLNAAGTELGLTQQAVSQRIRRLESALGMPLLLRSPRGSSLTAAGELVAGWAQPLLAASEDFADSVASLRAHRDGRLRVAASLTIAEHLLPEWIARWRGSLGDSGPVVQLTAANSSAVIAAVRQGEADLGFIETPEVPGDLGSRTIARDEVVIVAPPGHRWARDGVVSVRELAGSALVLREPGSGTRQALEDALSAAGHPLSGVPVAVLSTTLGIRSTIAAGTGPGALSSLAVSGDLRTGRLAQVRIEGLRIIRPLTAVWAGAREPRSAGGLFDAIGHLTHR